MLKSRLLATAVAAALTLTGCGVVPGTGDAKLTYKDSPLSKYLESVFSGGLGPDATDAERQEYYNEQNRKTEELVAQCMTKQGFEYVPNTQNNSITINSDDDNMWRPDDKDWVEKYGYGAINSPWQEQNETPGPEATEPPPDPNQAYIDSLSEAEQNAFNEALWGKQEQDPDADPNEAQEWRWENAGCYGWAQHEVQGDNPWDQEENKPIIEALQKFWENLQRDPAQAKLDADWSACMTEAGFPGFKTQPDAAQSIYDLQQKYYEETFGQGQENPDPNAGTMKDPEYAKIAEQEIPLAVADLGCREKTDYRQQQLKIQFAAEEQFIADHKEELDALKARAEQSQKK